jgi:predicted dehydrogenase
MMKVGMIGGGSWADRHLKSWRIAGYETVGIYNRTRARSEKLAQEFDIPDIYENWEPLVAREDVDVISISMPHNMHYDIALAAIDHGKHVYCEKPLAMNYTQAREMWSRSQSAGVKTGMQYNPRVDPAMIKLRELITSGHIGDITHVDLHMASDFCADPNLPMMWRFEKAVAGTGALGDMGTYMIDLARWFLGEFEAVSGMMTTRITERPIAPENFDMFENLAYARDNRRNNQTPQTAQTGVVDNEDETVFLARFEAGATGIIKASRIHNDGKLKIHGSEGTLERDSASGKIVSKLRAEREPTEVDVPARDPNETIASHFVRNLADDGDEGPTFYDGMKNMAVIDAVVRSAAERRWVELAEVEAAA